MALLDVVFRSSVIFLVLYWLPIIPWDPLIFFPSSTSSDLQETTRWISLSSASTLAMLVQHFSWPCHRLTSSAQKMAILSVVYFIPLPKLLQLSMFWLHGLHYGPVLRPISEFGLLWLSVVCSQPSITNGTYRVRGIRLLCSQNLTSWASRQAGSWRWPIRVWIEIFWFLLLQIPISLTGLTHIGFMTFSIKRCLFSAVLPS